MKPITRCMRKLSVMIDFISKQSGKAGNNMGKARP